MGRMEEARQSLAWALEMNPADLPVSAPEEQKQPVSRLSDIFRYPRSLAVSWITNLGAQTGYNGFLLWAPTLLVQILAVTPARAAFLMIFVNLAGLLGRIGMSFLSDAIGRKASGGIFGFGSAILIVAAALSRNIFFGTTSLFWLILIATNFFVDGGFAIVGPYLAEVWPSSLRTTGMGSALRIRRHRKGDRAIGTRAHCWIVERNHAAGLGGSAGASIFLPCSVVRPGGLCVRILCDRDERPLVGNDRAYARRWSEKKDVKS